MVAPRGETPAPLGFFHRQSPQGLSATAQVDFQEQISLQLGAVVDAAHKKTEAANLALIGAIEDMLIPQSEARILFLAGNNVSTQWQTQFEGRWELKKLFGYAGNATGTVTAFTVSGGILGDVGIQLPPQVVIELNIPFIGSQVLNFNTTNATPMNVYALCARMPSTSERWRGGRQ